MFQWKQVVEPLYACIKLVTAWRLTPKRAVAMGKAAPYKRVIPRKLVNSYHAGSRVVSRHHYEQPGNQYLGPKIRIWEAHHSNHFVMVHYMYERNLP